MLLTDEHITIHAQIQHLRKVKREIDLMINSLKILLPDRDPTEHRPVYVLNPKTGKREDPLLAAKLVPEYPGILAWMVKGCLEYQQRGLDPPPVVKEAVEEYQRDEDILSASELHVCAG